MSKIQVYAIAVLYSVIQVVMVLFLANIFFIALIPIFCILIAKILSNSMKLSKPYELTLHFGLIYSLAFLPLLILVPIAEVTRRLKIYIHIDMDMIIEAFADSSVLYGTICVVLLLLIHVFYIRNREIREYNITKGALAITILAVFVYYFEMFLIFIENIPSV